MAKFQLRSIFICKTRSNEKQTLIVFVCEIELEFIDGYGYHKIYNSFSRCKRRFKIKSATICNIYRSCFLCYLSRFIRKVEQLMRKKYFLREGRVNSSMWHKVRHIPMHAFVSTKWFFSVKIFYKLTRLGKQR